MTIGYHPNYLIAVRASLPQAAVDLEADTVELAIARCDGQSEGPYTAQRVRRELGPTRTTQKSYNRSVAAAPVAAVAPSFRIGPHRLGINPIVTLERKKLLNIIGNLVYSG